MTDANRLFDNAVHEYETEWVRILVKIRNNVNEIKKLRGTAESEVECLYHWEKCHITNDDLDTPETDSEKKCVFKLWMKVGSSHKCHLVVKEKRMGSKTFGLYSGARFEKGDIITVATEDEMDEIGGGETSKRLVFGALIGSRLIEGEKRCVNGIATNNGVVRATQRILPGQEICIDLRPSKFDPIMVLDAVVVKSKCKILEKETKGKVIKCRMSREDGIVFVVKHGNGEVEEIKLSGLKGRLLRL